MHLPRICTAGVAIRKERLGASGTVGFDHELDGATIGNLVGQTDAITDLEHSVFAVEQISDAGHTDCIAHRTFDCCNFGRRTAGGKLEALNAGPARDVIGEDDGIDLGGFGDTITHTIFVTTYRIFEIEVPIWCQVHLGLDIVEGG